MIINKYHVPHCEQDTRGQLISAGFQVKLKRNYFSFIHLDLGLPAGTGYLLFNLNIRNVACY